MPQQTPIYGLPYLVQTDPPDIAGSEQALAVATETAIKNHSVPVVSTPSDVASPYAGMVVFATSNKVLYIYDSGVWKFFGGLNTKARYYNTNTANVAKADGQALSFDTAAKTSPLIVASGPGNTTFTVGIDCHARVSVGVRTGNVAGIPYAYVVGAGVNQGGQDAQFSSTFWMLNFSTDFDINSGQTIEVHQNGQTFQAEATPSQSYFISISLEPR